MMRIDEKWSTRNGAGFTWWGHMLAQRVWADAERNDQGMGITRISAETRFLRDVPADPKLGEKIAVLNAFATLSSYLYDPDARCISLRCSIYAHDEGPASLGVLFGCAVAIQVADAHAKVDAMAEVLGGRPDVSNHPEAGVRPQPDEMLNVIDALFAPEGRKPSPYSAGELEQVQSVLQQVGAMATAGPDGVTAELPFFDATPAVAGGKGTALLQILNGVKNPQLGSGAFMLLQLPMTLPDADAAALSNELNAVEASDQFTRCHLLGSWCAKDGTPTFVSFLPAAAHNSGMLTNMALSMGLRSRFFAEHLRNK
jgi:hypothetical protein